MRSSYLLLRMEPKNVAMFRFLLEAYGHLAYFTVLERRPVLMKLGFSPDMERQVHVALAEIAASVPFTVEPWPLD